MRLKRKVDSTDDPGTLSGRLPVPVSPVSRVPQLAKELPTSMGYFRFRFRYSGHMVPKFKRHGFCSYLEVGVHMYVL